MWIRVDGHTYIRQFQADITVTVISDCACGNIDYCRVDGDMAKIFA